MHQKDMEEIVYTPIDDGWHHEMDDLVC